MCKNGKAVICVSTREATLKKRLRRHLKSLGFHKTDDGGFAPPGAGKDVIRTIHSVQRDDRLALNRKFISEHFSGLWLANCYFAHNSLEFPVLLGFCDARSPSRGKRDGL